MAERGMANIREVASSWAMTIPPAWWIACTPSVPSLS
jgi:hypothetical protein